MRVEEIRIKRGTSLLKHWDDLREFLENDGWDIEEIKEDK